MEINQLKYFKAVADLGKITAAAAELYVTPPTISTSISTLEQELDMQLFHRTGNRLILNRQGEIFLEYVNYILDSVADAQNDLRESLNDRKNSVIVASSSANLFADLFCDFTVTHPDIPLTTSNIHPRDITSAGINSRFSFLLASEQEAPRAYTDHCESLCLFEDAPALLMHPEHPLAHKEKISPQELCGKKVVWPRINHGLRDQVLAEFESLHLPPPELVLHSHQTALTMVKKNVAPALYTTHGSATLTAGLRLIPLDMPSCHWQVMLYRRKNHNLTEEDLLFLDYIKKYYSVRESN